MSASTRYRRGGLALAAGALLAGGAAVVAEGRTLEPRGNPRTLSLALEVDRDQARLVAFTVKDHPYRPVPAAAELSGGVQVSLVGPLGSITRGVDTSALCMEHGGDVEPHVEGDTILVHRDTFLVEMPEVQGYDRIQIQRLDGGAEDRWSRVRLGEATLDAAHFTAAGGGYRFADLAFASSRAEEEPSITRPAYTSGAVTWPEDLGDPEKYRVWGDEGEKDKRINLVIVPDGYRYADKATLIAHAQSLVTYFRGRPPFSEHDAFFNYILVFAYSSQTGADMCDCGWVRDTAMNTRFPAAGYACENSGNRCLYYGTANGGTSCDPNTSSTNISLAELRAPAQDKTLVMVNTARYGGCGGSRAVFAGANSSAADIAVHELGHSLGGLNDEYGGSGSCGTGSGINVSTDSQLGTWPEWIADLGAPRQGAKYYNQCVFRPAADCEMRTLNRPFCPVCLQRWSLVVFGHPRVAPSAPIAAMSPAASVNAQPGDTVSFSLTTRFAAGAEVANSITWKMLEPGASGPTAVANGVSSYTHAFPLAGTYALSAEVVADVHRVKPVKNGANLDLATWTIRVGAGPACGAEQCTGGQDEDCDGLVDCADPDCASSSACVPSSCRAAGANCRLNAECCSNSCNRKRGYCR